MIQNHHGHDSAPISQRGDTASGAGNALRWRTRGTGQVMVTRVGLELPSGLDFRSWEQAGAKIARIADSSAWCLGDWLLYGQDRYTDRYRQTIAAVGLDYQTLRNYAWVARRFELARRREQLSFQHHAEVAALTQQEQDDWLDLAEQGTWSRNELRRRVRNSRQPAGRELPGVALPRLNPPTERVARWREAAELTSQDLEDWIIATLDDGASQALSDAAPRTIVIDARRPPTPVAEGGRWGSAHDRR